MNIKSLFSRIKHGPRTLFAGTANFVPLANVDQSPMLKSVYSSPDLGQYVNTLFTTALSIGAILAVLRIAYAGYQYMTTDAWGSKQHAKEILGDVTLGLLLLLSIFLILKQINPHLLDLDVLGKVKQVQTTPDSSTSQSGQGANQPTNGVYNDPSLYGCSSGSGCGATGDIYYDASP